MNSSIISLLFIVALCVVFWLVFIRPKKNAAKNPSDLQQDQSKFKMSKGTKTLIGAIGGKIVEYFVIANLEDTTFKLNMWTFLMLLPGAIVGAVVGFATEIYDVKSNKKDEPTILQQDSASELMSYKKLLDEGVITQEEFDKKKQEILERK